MIILIFNLKIMIVSKRKGERADDQKTILLIGKQRQVLFH